jgi:RNA polymerase sigma factor (sigma-70 family)
LPEIAMADQPLRIILRRLCRLAGSVGDAAVSDAQLLGRFVADRDQAAFELLVWRHGTLVLNLCRRLLRHEQDAEDAFQATFLILARKAASIRQRTSCASWLYKVAYRVALAARTRAVARADREQPGVEELPAPVPPNELVWRDLRPILDEEVNRLPVKQRAVFLLCCLEGRTNAEAAEQLDCPQGTVLSRLSRARQRLRQRLVRRGICWSTALLTTSVVAHAQAEAVTAGLVGTTAQAALGIAAGKSAGAVVSAPAAALTEGVLRTMFLTKLKLALAGVLTLGLLGLGAGVLWRPALADPLSDAALGGGPEPGQSEAAPGKEAGARKKAASEDPVQTALHRLQSRRRLKELGLAMHSYADVYGPLPAPAIYQGHPNGLLPGGSDAEGATRSGAGSVGAASSGAAGSAPATAEGAGAALAADAKPLLSWRVALLPFLGQERLYKQFKLDEPWDSAHNQKLLAQIPAVYAAPGPPEEAGSRTFYQAIVGTGAAWEPRTQMRFPSSFADGTSNTILVVEAATPVPWTKPEDLPFVADQALPQLGGLFGGNFHALMADGAVQFLARNADEETLRYAIMRADGHPIDIAKLVVAGERGPEGTVDVKDLARQNARLKEAIAAAQKEVAREKEALERLKVQRGAGDVALDAKAMQQLQENAELQKKLDRILEELDHLRAERERLKQGGARRPRKGPRSSDGSPSR